jgi:hypothetical protein
VGRSYLESDRCDGAPVRMLANEIHKDRGLRDVGLSTR